MKQSASKWITISEDDQLTEVKKEKLNGFQRLRQWLNEDIENNSSLEENIVLNVKNSDHAVEEDPVKHRWFWVTGFLAVMVFATFLLVPSDRLKAFLPANLFGNAETYLIPEDPVFELIPSETSDAQQAEDQSGQEGFNGQNASNESVVKPQGTAVDVVVEPVYVEVDPAPAPTEEVEQTIELEVAEGTDLEEGDTLQPAAEDDPAIEPQDEIFQTEVVQGQVQEQIDEALSEQQKLIEQLTQELDAFKQESEAQAQQLTGQQDIVLFPAAGDPNTGLQTGQILGQQPGITATPLANLPTLTPPSVGVTNLPLAQPTTTYRLNENRVGKTPAQILAENQAKIAAGQTVTSPVQEAEMQANIAAANAQLDHVQGTPESGPMDLLWIALAFGLFFGFRTLRKRV